MKKRIYASIITVLVFLSLALPALADSSAHAIALSFGNEALLVDETGREIVPCGAYAQIYSLGSADPAAPELFMVSPMNASKHNASLWALMDAEGTLLTGFEYDSLNRDEASGLIVFSQNEKYGVMDELGRVLIEPVYTTIAPNGQGGYLALKTPLYEDKEDFIYLVQNDGTERRTKSRALAMYLYFEKGLCSAARKTGQEYRYGYLAPDGGWAIEPTFSYVSRFVGDYAIALGDGERYGLIDRSGRWALKTRYDEICFDWSTESAPVIARSGDTIEILENPGLKLYAVLSFPEATGISYENGCFAILDGEKYTLYGLDGRVIRTIGKEGYFSVSPRSSAAPTQYIYMDGNWDEPHFFLCDVSGNTLAENYRALQPLIQIGGRNFYMFSPYDMPPFRYGIMNDDGTERVSARYDWLYAVDERLLFAQMGDAWGMIDIDGNWILRHSTYEQLMD